MGKHRRERGRGHSSDRELRNTPGGWSLSEGGKRRRATNKRRAFSYFPSSMPFSLQESTVHKISVKKRKRKKEKSLTIFKLSLAYKEAMA